MDPSGKFAYVPNTYSNGNTVPQYTIDSVTGVLNPNTPATVTAVDPSSRLAYVVNRLDGSISMFTIDTATGNLTPNGTVADGALSMAVAAIKQ